MKKFIITITSGILGVVVLASPVLADSTISFSPANIDVTQGENFALVILVNPHDVKNGTVKLELEYPAELLEVKSFIFADGWMSSFTNSEYDLIDNTNGILIRTAGYPGGISSVKVFGFVLFSAKETGTGVIKIGNNSFIRNAENENVLSEIVAQTFVTITAPAFIQPLVPVLTTQPEETGPTEEEENIEGCTDSEATNYNPDATIDDESCEYAVEGCMDSDALNYNSEATVDDGSCEYSIAVTTQGGEEPSASQPQTQRTLLASIGGIVTLGTNSFAIGLIVIIVLLGGGYGIYELIRRKKIKTSK